MCFFHKWSKWNKVSEGRYLPRGFDIDDLENSSFTGQYVVMERTCQKCGKIQRKRFSY